MYIGSWPNYNCFNGWVTRVAIYNVELTQSQIEEHWSVGSGVSTVSSSLTANAVIKRTQAGSLLADSTLKRSQSGSVAGNAVLKKGLSGSLVANAVIKRASGTKTFASDAVIRRAQSGSITANAVFAKASGTKTFVADAVATKVGTGSFMANAVIKATVSFPQAGARPTIYSEVHGSAYVPLNTTVDLGALTWDSTVKAVVVAVGTSGEGVTDITLGGVALTKLVEETVSRKQSVWWIDDLSGVESGDHVVVTPINGGYLAVYSAFALAANGPIELVDVQQEYAGTAVFTSTLDFDLGGWDEGLCIAFGGFGGHAEGNYPDDDEVVEASTSTSGHGAVTYRDNVSPASVTLHSNGWEPWKTGVSHAAALFGVSASGLTINAVIRKAQSSSFSADAILMPFFTADAWIAAPSVTGSFTSDSIVKRSLSGSLVADAVLKKSASGSFKADAAFALKQTGSLTANAVIRRSMASALVADAVIRRTGQAGSLKADAITRRSQSSSFTANATIKRAQTGSLAANATTKRSMAGSATADAVIKRSRSGSFVADAALSAGRTGSVAADAILRRGQTGSLTANAVIKRAMAGSLSADAVTRKAGSGSLTADAITRRSQSGSLTANAVLRAAATGSLKADAAIRRGQTGSATADAVLRRAATSSFAADAVIEAPLGGSITANALFNSVSRCIWTTPGNLVQIDASETLTFLMPQVAASNMHFQIEIDTDPGFAAPTVWTSHSSLTGWEYWDGDSWEPVPQAGVPNTHCGNEARYTIQTPLDNGTYYRRVRAGVI